MVLIHQVTSYQVFVMSLSQLMDEQMLYSYDNEMINELNYVFCYGSMNHQVVGVDSFINITLLINSYHLYRLKLMKSLLISNKNQENH
jgi:hypothetical protein